MLTIPSVPVAIALFLAASCSWACMSEILEQCIQRYGAPLRVSVDQHVYVFEIDGLRVFASIHEGKVEEIVYKKSTPSSDYTGPTPQMSTNEIHEILGKNAHDATWEKSHPDLYTVNYMCRDRNLTATYSTLTGLLTIADQGSSQKLAERISELDTP